MIVADDVGVWNSSAHHREKLRTMVPAVSIVGEFLTTFGEHPPSQASGTLSVEKALGALQEGSHKN